MLDIITIAIGLITEAGQAEGIIAEGKADVVALARGFLWDPVGPGTLRKSWARRPRIPPQYLRARPAARADVFGGRQRSRA